MNNWIDEIPFENQKEALDAMNASMTFDEEVEVSLKWHPDGRINVSPIKTLDGYFKHIYSLSNRATWYRGESKDHDKLVPKLYRNLGKYSIQELLEIERDFFNEFRRRGKSYKHHIDNHDSWAWYFLMQHYGGPTRLLDWTNDASVALFFALEASLNYDSFPVVYTVQSTILTAHAFRELEISEPKKGIVLYPGESPTDKWISNLKMDSDLGSNQIPNSPIALLPPYSDQRIKAQRSCFILFGNHTDGKSESSNLVRCHCCDNRSLKKLIIDKDSKVELMRQLARIGITHDTVYPGLDGLSRDITSEVF